MVRSSRLGFEKMLIDCAFKIIVSTILGANIYINKQGKLSNPRRALLVQRGSTSLNQRFMFPLLLSFSNCTRGPWWCAAFPLLLSISPFYTSSIFLPQLKIGTPTFVSRLYIPRGVFLFHDQLVRKGRPKHRSSIK